MSASIDDLLNALQNPEGADGSLVTWDRIMSGDGFDELGLEKKALNEFLSVWKAENPYSDMGTDTSKDTSKDELKDSDGSR